MNKNREFFYWTVTIGVVVVLHLFLGETVAVSADVRSAYSKDGELSEVRLAFFSPQGKRLYYLESGTLSYFTEQKSMYLHPMRIIYTTPEGALVTLESEAGEVSQAGAIIELQGDVYINKLISPDLPVQTAATDNLTIDTTNQIATTDERAVIQWDDRSFSGDGMEIDLNSGKMRLLENVEVRDVAQ